MEEKEVKGDPDVECESAGFEVCIEDVVMDN